MIKNTLVLSALLALSSSACVITETPPRDVGSDAARVLADELELAPGHAVAVLLDVELDGVVELRGAVGELPRVRQDDADFYRLRVDRCGRGKRARPLG